MEMLIKKCINVPETFGFDMYQRGMVNLFLVSKKRA